MPADLQADAERSRLARAYASRDAERIDTLTYSWLHPETHWLDFVIQRFIFSALADQGWTPTTASRCRMLEVGCGTGRVLRWCYDAGFRALYGCDALPWRVEEAIRTTPFAHLMQADMSQLPFPDGWFDCVLQVVTVSSCLDGDVRKRGAREMLRVLKDGGCLVWCDLKPHRQAPGYVRGVSAQALRALFPHAHITIRSVGANPRWVGVLTSLINQGPLRLLVRRLPWLRNRAWARRRPITAFPQVVASLLEHFSWGTWYLAAVIRKSPVR